MDASPLLHETNKKAMVAKTFGAAPRSAGSVNYDRSQCWAGSQYIPGGLPDIAVRESLMRVEIAIKSAGLRMPRERVVINLAPANLTKSRTAFDLPIALGILAASGQLTHSQILKEFLIIGELSLDNSINHVRGIIPMAVLARDNNYHGIILPKVNAFG